MPESKVIGIRVPDKISDAIETRVRATGKKKTDVVLELLRQALGMLDPATKDLSVNTVNIDVYNEDLLKKLMT